MTLLLQIVGAAMALFTVAVLIRGGAPLRSNAAAGIGIAAVAAAVAWQPAYSIARDAFVAGKAPRSDRSAAFVAAGRASSLDVDLINGLAAHIPRRGTYAIVPELSPDALEYQWLTYQLLPRRLTDPEHADILLFYRTRPSAAEYDRRAFPRPVMLTPDFGFAERRRAG
jgi:hypothetical protein